MNINTKQSKLNIVSMLIVMLMTGAIFFFFQVFYMPHDFDNLGGKHAWVSGSTIKFVNIWLEEGADNLHFTNIERYSSVELQTMEDREPYVSYPTGVTFMVWTGAKLLGKSHIDVHFLKYFQLVMYGIECILMSLLAYVFVEREFELREKYKVAISVFVATLWMTLPVNNWFLTNTYWADMAVFMWIIMYLLLECISDWEIIGVKTKRIISVFKMIVIVAGVLTDYFFCIVVFLGAVFNAIFVANNNDEQKITKIIKASWEYIVPVVTALVIFVWQISFTSNWSDYLFKKFLHRTGLVEAEDISGKFLTNFIDMITCNSKFKAVLLLAIEVTLLVGGIAISIKKHKNYFDKKSTIVVLMMIISPVLQLFMFWNHSSIHQYAMVKVGVQLIGVLLGIMYLMSIVLADTKHKSVWISTSFAVVTILLMVVMGYPGRIIGLYEEKNSTLDYSIDRAIYENTDYYDVCFSYTYVVPSNPPMDLSVTEKLVYQISNEEDIDTMFDNLDDAAKKILVIDKTGNGSNAYVDVEKTDEIETAESMAMQNGVIIYEDENCVLVRMQQE